MRVTAILLAVTLLLLLIETIAPVNIAERMIFSSKHKTLLSEAETIVSSLNTTQVLTSEGAEEVMAVLGNQNAEQILITDEKGTVLYSADRTLVPLSSCCLYPEVVSALMGNDAFRCDYTGNAFLSAGAIPIMARGVITGCVYMAEIDQEQAALLSSIQNNGLRLAIISVLVCLMLALLFGGIIIKKNERLLESIRRVRNGDYESRIEIKGQDEFAKMAEEFNALTERLQQTEQNRRQFVSDASHELRTPLAAMRLLSDSILQNDMDQETIREFVQDISSESDRLTRMTSKLLSLTALDSRQMSPEELEIVDMGQCCKKAVRMLTPFAKERGAEIEQSSEDHCCVLAREDDIFQLILNLAENGVKYSQNGGQVRLIAYAQGDTAVLIVEDNGIGIPETELGHIFRRFYRVDKARSRSAGGAGLGLAIVQETAEKFGGTVEAANRPQGGARFTVRFPLHLWEGEL